MNKSTITIDVITDESRVPETIAWSASDTTAEGSQKAKAMMISFWDSAEKAALRIDLWTKDMMVDEMAEFYYQMMVTMADTFSRATGHKEFIEQMKKSAHDFYARYGELRKAEMKPPK